MWAMRSELLPSSAAIVSTSSLLRSVHRRTARPPIAMGIGVGWAAWDRAPVIRLRQAGRQHADEGGIVRRVDHHLRPIVIVNARPD
jgi:hypothetical protein